MYELTRRITTGCHMSLHDNERGVMQHFAKIGMFRMSLYRENSLDGAEKDRPDAYPFAYHRHKVPSTMILLTIHFALSCCSAPDLSCC